MKTVWMATKKIRQNQVANPMQSKDLKQVKEYLKVLRALEDDPEALQPIKVYRVASGQICPADTMSAFVVYAASDLTNIPRLRVIFTDKVEWRGEDEDELKQLKKTMAHLMGGGGNGLPPLMIQEAPQAPNNTGYFGNYTVGAVQIPPPTAFHVQWAQAPPPQGAAHPAQIPAPHPTYDVFWNEPLPPLHDIDEDEED